MYFVLKILPFFSFFTFCMSIVRGSRIANDCFTVIVVHMTNKELELAGKTALDTSPVFKK